MFVRHLTQLIMSLFEKSPLGKSSRKQPDGYKYVALPDYTLVVGIITVFFTLAIFVVSLVLKAPVWVPVIWIIFSLLGFSLIIAWKNVKILYNDDEIIETTFWGKQNRFVYDEIVSCEKKSTTQTVKYYTADGRSFKVDQSTEDAIYLDIFIIAKYKKLHNNKKLPQRQK
ncbi:MAG: hypothetical protein IJZ88_04155 [Clostridia bacterium]|nr:hypothetical protein [Clostridia bacterium]